MKKLLALLLMAALVLGCVPAMADYVLIKGQNAEGLFGNPLQELQVEFVKQVDAKTPDKSAGFPYAAFLVFGVTNEEVRTFMRAQDGAVERDAEAIVSSPPLFEIPDLTGYWDADTVISNETLGDKRLNYILHTYSDPASPPVMDNINYEFTDQKGDTYLFVLDGPAEWKEPREGSTGLYGSWEFSSTESYKNGERMSGSQTMQFGLSSAIIEAQQ